MGEAWCTWPELGALCGGLAFLVWQGRDGLSDVYVFILYALAVWGF